MGYVQASASAASLYVGHPAMRFPACRASLTVRIPCTLACNYMRYLLHARILYRRATGCHCGSILSNAPYPYLYDIPVDCIIILEYFARTRIRQERTERIYVKYLIIIYILKFSKCSFQET